MPHVDGVDDGVGYGVKGGSKHGDGVYGGSEDGAGLYGTSDSGDGVYGHSEDGYGMVGYSYNGYGVYSFSHNSNGVYGESLNGDGVDGKSINSVGVNGESFYGVGVGGKSYHRHGVAGMSVNAYGVYGLSHAGDGVVGWSESGAGVFGESVNYDGVHGESSSGVGVFGKSENGYAAFLQGDVHVTGHLRIDGDLSKSGGSFKIDHPLDPANKYLHHSFVESSDMKNVYDGIVVLNDKGEVEVDLPDWFGTLNKDYRYQLTAIGAPGPNLYIAKEISESKGYTDTANYNNNNNSQNHSSFRIAGGTSGMKVSWQITGIRKDPWANAHRIEVEEDKPDKERDHYIYPELYGQPAERGISSLHFPQEMKVPLVTKNK